MEDVDESSRTELDSHANMPVTGRNAYILSKIGETVDVAPFTPDYKPMRRFNALMQDFKLPWQASKLIMALKV